MDFDSQQAPHYMESRQSSEQAERRVTAVLLPLFRAMGESEDFLKNSLRVKQVDFNIFAVGTDRIVSTFCDEK